MKKNGVSEGARTLDIQDHNLALYQLSYTHHIILNRTIPRCAVSNQIGKPRLGAPRFLLEGGRRPNSIGLSHDQNGMSTEKNHNVKKLLISCE